MLPNVKLFGTHLSFSRVAEEKQRIDVAIGTGPEGYTKQQEGQSEIKRVSF